MPATLRKLLWLWTWYWCAYGGFARRRIDADHARVGIDQRLLLIGERDRLRFEAVGGIFQAAGGEQCVAGDEPRGVELPHGCCLEPHEPLVLKAAYRRRRREQLGVENRADLPAGVVKHPVRIHDAIALAKDDVPLHVDFQRLVGTLRDLLRTDFGHPPANDPVRFDVDRAEWPQRRRQALDGQSFNDDVDAAAQDANSLTTRRREILCLESDVAPLHHLDAAKRRSTRRDQRTGRRHRLRVLRRLDVRVLLRGPLCRRLRAEPRQSAGDDRRPGGGRRPRGRQLKVDVGERGEFAEPARRLQPIATRIGRRRMFQQDLLLRSTFDVGNQLGGFDQWRRLARSRRHVWSAAVDPHHRFGSPNARRALLKAAVTLQVPDVVFALPPMLGLAGRNANRRGLIRAGQRDRVLGQRRSPDTAPVAATPRPGANRERRVSLAFAEAAATCVSNRRSDRHPCQSSDKRRACVAQFSRMPAASSQSKTPPAITKKVATKIAADYRTARRPGSSRVQ